MKTTALPAPQYLRECFEVVDGLLYWKSRPLNHFQSEKSWRCHEAKCAGRLAGRFMARVPYQQVLLDGSRLLAHRIVAHMHGIDTARCIDHIDGNPKNNRPENLRACSQAENTRNNAGWAKKAEPAGVHRKDNGRFVAHVRKARANKHLGTFQTIEEAIAARLAAEVAEYGEFARSASRGPINAVAAERLPQEHA